MPEIAKGQKRAAII